MHVPQRFCISLYLLESGLALTIHSLIYVVSVAVVFICQTFLLYAKKINRYLGGLFSILRNFTLTQDLRV